MKRDLWEGQPKCPQCKGWMKKTEVLLEGIRVRAWRCSKCREEALHPIDAEKALTISKLKKQGISVKIGVIRDGPYVRFPKELASVIHKGDTALIQAKDENEFIIKVKHED